MRIREEKDMQTKNFRKGLVVGIILLFIGVTIASGISLKVNKSNTLEEKASDSELVNFPVYICRPDGIEDYEVCITQQQVEDLDNLIDDFKQKLKDIETLEETSILFNDTISSLYEIGVIPKDINIEETQQLITGDIYNLKSQTIIDKKNTQSTLPGVWPPGIWNDCCYIFSNATNVGFWGKFYFGCYEIDYLSGDHYYYAKGLVWTSGLLGIQTMLGRFKGDMGEEIYLPGFHSKYGYVGTLGLMGIHIPFIDLLLGFAITAKFIYI